MTVDRDLGEGGGHGYPPLRFVGRACAAALLVCPAARRGLVVVEAPVNLFLGSATMALLVCLRGGDGRGARARGGAEIVVGGPQFICFLTQRHHGAAPR